MSWDAYLSCDECGPVVEQNYTHNTNRMISEALRLEEGEHAPPCPGSLGESIGPAWWFRLHGMTGAEGADYLNTILRGLRSDPGRFRAMNPPNGWGDFDRLAGVLAHMAAASAAHPAATWSAHG